MLGYEACAFVLKCKFNPASIPAKIYHTQNIDAFRSSFLDRSSGNNEGAGVCKWRKLERGVKDKERKGWQNCSPPKAAVCSATVGLFLDYATCCRVKKLQPRITPIVRYTAWVTLSRGYNLQLRCGTSYEIRAPVSWLVLFSGGCRGEYIWRKCMHAQTSWQRHVYTVSQKTHQLWNGIARNYNKANLHENWSIQTLF